MIEYPPEIKSNLFASGGGLAEAIESGSNDTPSSGSTGCPYATPPPEERFPKAIVTEIVLEASGSISASYTDLGHDPVPHDDGGRFCFAPGKETVTIKWKTENPEESIGGRLFLFYRGGVRPVWTKELSTGEVSGGTADWDGSVADAAKPTFPSGFVHVGLSPYKIQIELYGNVDTSKKRAWTYFDIRVEKIDVDWGEYAWLLAERNDVDVSHREKILGPADKSKKGFEEEILDELKTENAKPGPGTEHKVILTSDLYAKKLPTAIKLEEGADRTDYLEYKKLWADGARIPFKASVKILKADKTTGVYCPDALAGAKLIWDWRDKDLERWKTDLKPTTQTEDYLTALIGRNRNVGPIESTNCPVALGGKLGAGEARVFPLPAKEADFKWKLTECRTRNWAVLSLFPTNGSEEERSTTGAIFQPARMAGDRYKVRVSLDFTPELESNDDWQVPAPASTEVGTFEVFRRLNINYLVRGNTASLGVDPAVVKAKLEKTYLDECRIILKINQIAVKPDVYKQAVQKAVSLSEDAFSANKLYPSFPILARCLVNFDPPDGSPGIVLFDQDVFSSNIEKYIKERKMRILKYGDVLNGDKITGQSSGAIGLPLSNAVYDVKEVRAYFVVLENDREFQHNEDVVATATGNVLADGDKIKFPTDTTRIEASTAKSCWSHRFVEVTSDLKTYSTSVDIDFGGQETVRVSYGKTGFKLELKVELGWFNIRKIDTGLKRLSAAWADENAELVITLTHKGKVTGNHKDRIQKLKDLITAKLRDPETPTFIDRKVVFEAWKGPYPALLHNHASGLQREIDGLLGIYFFPKVISAYAEAEFPTEDGLILLHIPGKSNGRDLPIFLKNFKQQKVQGAAYADTFPGDRSKTVTFVASVDANGPQMYEEETKSYESIFAHEVGHGLYLPHAPTISTPRNPPNAEAGCHVKDDNCLMNYDVDSEHFCAMCILRMRGWDWAPDENTLRLDYEYQVTVELDDVDSLFASDATTDQGKKERLQYMGLLNRPLDHPEIEDCFTFSQQHALTLFPALNGALPDVVKATYKQMIKDFMLDDGAVPAPGSFAKIRCPGGYSVMYSQNFLMASIREEDEGTEVAKKYENYMLGASPFEVEKSFLKANPTIGKIPLKATVSRRLRDSEDPWDTHGGRDAWVYFQLVPPDDISGAPAVVGTKQIAGGTAYFNDVKAPDLKAVPLAYYDSKVNQFKPAPGTPEANNVNVDIGGKRGGQVFCDTRAKGFKSLKYEKGFPFASRVRSDVNGVARIVFDPSLVGGDHYKLRVFVGPATQDMTQDRLDADEDGVAETGTMVRWRTVRVCHNIVQPPAADESETAASVCKQADGSLMPEIEKFFGDLSPVDISGVVTTELARSYCQTIIEPAALQRVSIQNHAADIVAEAIALSARYPLLNTMSRKGGFSVYKEPMMAVPGTNNTKFALTLTGTPQPGFVTVRPDNQAGVGDAWLSDKKGPFEKTDKGAQIDIKGAGLNYTTRVCTVEFDTAKNDISPHVCYYFEGAVNIPAIFEWPATSPFLFNFKLPRIYRPLAGPGFLPVDDVGELEKPNNFHWFIDSRTLGFSKSLMLTAAVRGIQRNGGFMPGLMFFQAHAIDNYAGIWETGRQEGKGVENGIFLFDTVKPHTAQRHASLTVHEFSHGMYLWHAPGASKPKPHEHDPADTCVMSYDDNDGDHCGKCVAALRGIKARSPALN